MFGWDWLAHSQIHPSLYPRHSSFSNPSVALPTYSSFSNPSGALPTLQLILQPFRCFIYVTAYSPTLPLLHLRHSVFFNPSFTSPTSRAVHLRHLASRPWNGLNNSLLLDGFSYSYFTPFEVPCSTSKLSHDNSTHTISQSTVWYDTQLTNHSLTTLIVFRCRY